MMQLGPLLSKVTIHCLLPQPIIQGTRNLHNSMTHLHIDYILVHTLLLPVVNYHKKKKLAAYSTNPIGIHFVGNFESLLSSLIVPIPLARLYKTLERPWRLSCSIAFFAWIKKSSGTRQWPDERYAVNIFDTACN